MEKISRFLKLALLAASILALASCGGGGGNQTSTATTAVIGSSGGIIAASNGAVVTIDPNVVVNGTSITVKISTPPPSTSSEITPVSSQINIEIPTGALSSTNTAVDSGISIDIPLPATTKGAVSTQAVTNAAQASYRYIQTKIGSTVTYAKYQTKVVGNQVVATTKISYQYVKQQVTQGNPNLINAFVQINTFVNTFTPIVLTAGTLFEVTGAGPNDYVNSQTTKTVVPTGKLPLVLVHGIQVGCEGNAEAYKKTWEAFRQFFFSNLGQPLRDKYQLYTYSYQTDLPIKDNGLMFASALKKSFGPLPSIVLAHSMGGLVTRSAMIHHAAIGANIGGVITLGTPHHGTKKILNIVAPNTVAAVIDSMCFFAADPQGAKDMSWDQFDDPNYDPNTMPSVNPFLVGADGINTLEVAYAQNHPGYYQRLLPYAGTIISPAQAIDLPLCPNLIGNIILKKFVLPPGILRTPLSICTATQILDYLATWDLVVPEVSARYKDYVNGTYLDKASWNSLPRTYTGISHSPIFGPSFYDSPWVFLENPDTTVGGITTDLLNLYGTALPALAPAFTTAINGFQVNLDANTSTPGANITSYAWNFGDGATGTGVTVSHTYAAYSSIPWSVTLTVTDSYGRTASISQNVTTACPPGQVIQNGQCVTPPVFAPHFAYVADFGANNISAYSINPTTGALNLVNTPVASGNNPVFIAVDPTGKFAYAANYDSGNAGPSTVSMYTINQATGALTAVGAPVGTGSVPISITVDPTGKFVYVANQGSNNIWEYNINPTSGALTVAGAPVPAGAMPTSVTVDPTGKFAYVANMSSGNISAYTISPTTGALTTVGAPMAAGTKPISVTVEPSGKFAYVANYGDGINAGSVSVYAINQTTGALSAVGVPVAAGIGAYSIALDPTGKFAYVPNSISNDVSVYSINPVTGALASGTVVAAGLHPYSAIVDSTGKFAYVANNGSNNVSIYTINPATGALTAAGTATTPLGPASIATRSGSAISDCLSASATMGQLIFCDDFSGATIDTTKWTWGGSTVTQSNGNLVISEDVTDTYSHITTIPLNATSVSIRMRHWMTPANNWFFPGITLFDANNIGIGELVFLKSDWASDYCSDPTKFNKVLLRTWNGSLQCNVVGTKNSDSYYNRWTETIYNYNSITGVITIDLDADGVIDLTYNVPAANRAPVHHIYIGGYGWYTGHKHILDYFAVGPGK